MRFSCLFVFFGCQFFDINGILNWFYCLSFCIQLIISWKVENKAEQMDECVKIQTVAGKYTLIKLYIFNDCGIKGRKSVIKEITVWFITVFNWLSLIEIGTFELFNNAIQIFMHWFANMCINCSCTWCTFNYFSISYGWAHFLL